MIDARGGDLNFKAGDGNKHGDGDPLTIGPGNYRAGDGGPINVNQKPDGRI